MGALPPNILNAFLRRYVADEAAGTVLPAEDYVALWPEHGDGIAAEYRRLVQGTDTGTIAEAPGAAPRVTDSALPARHSASKFGPYLLLEELGRGGQGVVWLAEDSRLSRKVALKVLNGATASLEGIERFRREAAIASRLDHPGICTVYEAGAIDGIPFIAMRPVAGRPWRRRVEETRAPGSPARREEIATLVETAASAADALHAAHEAGVVHRDVKPGNVMITPSGAPVLLDFGLAGDLSAQGATITGAGDLLGTPAYLAPEQLSETSARVDRRIDVYSLGVTLFEMIAGRRPYDAPTRDALYREILAGSPPRLRVLAPGATRDLETVVATAMARDRNRRYQTAADFAADLRAILAQRPIRARRPSLARRGLLWIRRSPGWAAAALLALVAAGALGSWIASRPEVARARRLEHARENEDLLTAAFLGMGDDGRVADAIAGFRRSLDRFGPTPEAVSGLALALLQRGDVDECFRLLDHHEATFPRHPALGWARLEALEAVGRKEEARAAEAKIERSAGAAAHFFEGLYLLRQGELGRHEAFVRAADSLTIATLSAPPRFLYHLTLAHALMHAGSEHERRRTARLLCECWPAEPAAWWHAAHLLRDLHEGEALACSEHAVRLAPNDAPTLGAHAALLRHLRQLAPARDTYLRALHLRPDITSFRSNLAEIEQLSGNHEAVLREAEIVLAQDPRDERAWLFRGQALIALGRPTAEARRAFEKALRLAPDEPEFPLAFARALGERGELADAEAVARAACAGFPRHARLRGVLAWVLGRRSRFAEAETVLREGLALDPELTDLHHTLLVALMNQGKLAAARDHLEHLPASCALEEDFTTALRADTERLSPLETALDLAVRTGTVPEDDEAADQIAQWLENRGDPAVLARYLRARLASPAERGPATRADRHSRAARVALHAARVADDPAATATFVADALACLEADLTTARDLIARDRFDEDTLRTRIEGWLEDPEFALLNDPATRASLATAEREAVEAFLARLRAALEERP